MICSKTIRNSLLFLTLSQTDLYRIKHRSVYSFFDQSSTVSRLVSSFFFFSFSLPFILSLVCFVFLRFAFTSRLKAYSSLILACTDFSSSQLVDIPIRQQQKERKNKYHYKGVTSSCCLVCSPLSFLCGNLIACMIYTVIFFLSFFFYQ